MEFGTRRRLSGSLVPRSGEKAYMNTVSDSEQLSDNDTKLASFMYKLEKRTKNENVKKKKIEGLQTIYRPFKVSQTT